MYNVITGKGGPTRVTRQEEKGMDERMTRLELLTLLLSIQALLETDNIDKAKEIIAKVIAEAENS